MKIVSCHKKEECDKEISQKISEVIAGLLKNKVHVVMGIPGGRSVQGIFNLLKKESINWSKVHIFMVDERMVPLDDDQSNFKLAKKTFISELIGEGKLPEKNIHPFDIEKGVNSYEKELKKFGGRYDLVILGVGEDGHVGALFPNHHSLNDNGSFITMKDSPKPPSKRMTASMSLLKKSSVAVVLFYGEGKRKAYQIFKNESINIEQCPAKLALSIGKVYVVTDLK